MLPQRNINSLTYREKIRDCAHLTRELIEHLDQALLPRIHRMKSDTRLRPQSGDDEIPDVTVRNLVSTLLESETFAEELCQRLDGYGRAIVSETEHILEPRR